MSLSGGMSKSKSTTSSSSQTDPWDVTIPYLKDFLSNLDAAAPTPGATAGQRDAFGNLIEKAKAGNPWESEINALTGQIFDTPDRTAGVQQGLDTIKSTYGDVAAGKYLDVTGDPRLKAMLDQLGQDTANGINAQFAAAGRDLSGANQRTVAEGVTRAQTPVLLEQYNKERDRQLQAGQIIGQAEKDAATTQAGLEQLRTQLQTTGIATADKAVEAGTYGDNQILNLEQQLKQLGIQDLGMLASILFPAAGLGAQESGTSTTSGKSSGIGAGIKFA